MNKPFALSAILLAAALALTACGGDSDDSPSSPAPGDPGTEQPGPTPTVDRIEWLDTEKSAARTDDKVQSLALSRLPDDARVERVELGPLPALKSAAAQVQDKAQPLKIGEGREVTATAAAGDLQKRLNWETLADGSQVAAVAFVAEGARAIRLGVRVDSLPSGTVLRFYGEDASDVVEMTASEVEELRVLNASADMEDSVARTVWGPDTPGAVSTLELQLPPGANPGQVQLSVPRLSHLTQTVAEVVANEQRAKLGIDSAGGCNIDVMCTPVLDFASRSVARMVLTYRDGLTALCTGTLMNDAQNSRTPYFLTANHCIAEQDKASSLITYWFFRAAGCEDYSNIVNENGTWVAQGSVRLDGGAELLDHVPSSDGSLVRLRQSPPHGVVYAGSYFGSDVHPGQTVIGLHHPQGDLQKVSVGEIMGYSSCADTTSGPSVSPSCSESDSSGNYFVVGWDAGTTEGGSSGSSLLADVDDGTYVVGTLYSGNASCQNPDGIDTYGRFERNFAAGMGRWLVP